MPQKFIFSKDSQSSGQPKNNAKTLLFSYLSPVFFANVTAVAFVLLCNSRFNFHCYTQCEAMYTQKLARKWELQPFATSCAKDSERHSLVQTSFAELPNNTIYIYIYSLHCTHALKTTSLQTILQVISNSVFLLASPIYPPSPLITFLLWCAHVCMRACVCVGVCWGGGGVVQGIQYYDHISHYF